MKKLIYILMFLLATLAMQAQFTKGISQATNILSQSAITLGSTTWTGSSGTSNSFTSLTSSRFNWEGDSLNFQVELTGVSSGTIALTAPSSTIDSITVDLWIEAYTQGSAYSGFSAPSTTVTVPTAIVNSGPLNTLATAYQTAWGATSFIWSSSSNTYSVPSTWIPVGSVPLNNHSAWFSPKSIARPGSMLGGKLWALVTNKRSDCPVGARTASGVYIGKLNVWAIQRWNVVINK